MLRPLRKNYRLTWLLAGLILPLLATRLSAQLKADPESVDLGRRAQEQLAAAQVKLTNTGSQAVEIKSVSADCSCTAGTPEKTNLAPGESTTLKITLETRSYQGEIYRRVLLDTSAGELTIPVKVFVAMYENWSLAPYPVILPPSMKSQSASAEMTITYSGQGDAKINGFKCETDWLKAAVTRREGNKFIITISKLPTAPAGNHSIKITAETSDPKTPQVTFATFIPVSSPVHVLPTPLVFPMGKVHQRSVLSAKITGWSSDADPELKLQWGEVKLLEHVDDGYAFEVALTPEAAGSFTQLLRIYQEGKLEAEIPVIIRVEP